MTRNDIHSAIITGVTTGVLLWRILVYLDAPSPYGLPMVSLVVIMPVLWLLGVWLGYFLSQWYPFFAQFSKFVAIGFTNAMVDFGVLYLLIALTGAAGGVGFSVFKACSFIVATFHSYYWNRHWSFQTKERAGREEFGRFFAVAAAAVLVNVAIASIVVILVGPQFNFTPEAWAGIGSVVGSASALIFSFIGFRLYVFAK